MVRLPYDSSEEKACVVKLQGKQQQQQHLVVVWGSQQAWKESALLLVDTYRQHLPACWEAKPGAGVCHTGLTMAVNLDKEAYYRRIKRLYSNWKVQIGRFEACAGVNASIKAVFNVGKVGCWRMRAAKLAAFFSRGSWLCCRRERWCFPARIQRRHPGGTQASASEIWLVVLFALKLFFPQLDLLG